MTEAELLRLCPLDGPAGRDNPPRDRPLSALVDEVGDLGVSLGDDGERSWSKMFARALARESDDEKLTYMGHAVALLLERGPGHWWRTRTDRPGVQQLLSDIVVKWPPQGV